MFHLRADAAKKAIATVWPGSDYELRCQPTKELERLYRKQRLAAAYRIFARFGFDMGSAGHITARDPIYPDHFWVNPFGIHFSKICVSDLVLVDHSGKIVEGEGMLNQAAFAIHSELHKARPDVVAAAHSHSLYGKAWATLNRLLDPISQDAAAFYEDHTLFNDFTGVVFDLNEGERIAAALGNCKAVILQNHGLLTVGSTVESAVWWYMSLENACKTQIIAEGVAKPGQMSQEVARKTRKLVGSELGGLIAFQPYWNKVISEEPDLLD